MNYRSKWDIILGCIICIYVLLLNVFTGKVSFSGVFFIVGIILIIFHYIKGAIYSNIRLKRYFNFIKIITIVGLIFFISIELAIVVYPKKDDSKAQYVIVLGAGIRGEEISLTLKQRLNKAIEYCNKDKDVYIVVSGGKGEGEDITEAEAMKRYLIKNGVEMSNIIKEDSSTNTFENFKFSKDVIESHSNKLIENINVKVITSDFHALRSNMLAKRNGYKEITFYTNLTFPTLIPVTYSRECFALVKSFLFDK